MSNSSSKSYKVVKNFIHNEEKITKDDIRGMIRDAVNVEVHSIVESKKEYINSVITGYVQRLVERGLSDNGHLYFNFKERVAQELSDEVAKYIRSQLNIDVSVKSKENE